MQITKDKKQILTIIISILISIFLVATATYAVTTVGNNVTIGGALSVTGAATMSSTLSVTDATTLGGLTATGAISLPNNSITDAMVVNTITASNYLPLSGGTVTGNLAVNGTTSLTATTLSDLVASGSVSLPNSSITNTMLAGSIAASKLIGTDINIVGTIATGTWQGTPITTQYGGTGKDWSSITQGSLPYFSATGTFSTLSPGTSGYFLKAQGTGANPAWANVVTTYARTATKVVCAATSLDTANCDYVCDGTNDQDEINQAINAISSTGGTVLLLEGNYFIASSTSYAGINIATSSISLIGSGKNTILHRDWDTASDDGVITVGDGGTSTPTGVVIANLSINGCKATSTVSACKNKYEGTPNHGIYFNKKITKSKIQDTWVYDCRGYGIYLYGGSSSGSENTNNLIEGNDVRGSYYAGIHLNFSNNNIVSENNVQSNVGFYGGIQVSASDNNTISDNNVQLNTIGIYLWTYSDRNTITGNVIYANVGDEIALYAAAASFPTNNNLISSNSIYDTSGTCISVGSYCNNTLIIGNEITGGCTKISDSGTNTTIQQRDWFEIEGSLATAFATTSATTTLTATSSVLGVDVSSATTTINLPAASGIAGRQYTIKKTDASANAVIIDGNASETIDGSVTYSLTGQWKYVAIVSDGTNWLIVANN